MGPNWQTFVILFILVVVLFGGKGRISALMGDMASGIKSFKKGLAEEDESPSTSAELKDGSAKLDATDQTPADKTEA